MSFQVFNVILITDLHHLKSDNHDRFLQYLIWPSLCSHGDQSIVLLL